jgi:hypothetical protein
MDEFERLIGEWHAEGEIPMEPPMKVTTEATIERLGPFRVFPSLGQPAEMPATLSIIGGGAAGEPQPMHYFDSRGVRREYPTNVQGATRTIWRAPGEDWSGPDGPGFNQRFIAEMSAGDTTIEGRWERGMGDAGDQWELEFAMRYVLR